MVDREVIETSTPECKSGIIPFNYQPGKISMYHYTYLLKHKPSNKFYYGVRSSNILPEEDLWIKYFSSSKHIKKLIQIDGKDSFDYEIRCLFKTRKQANKCEERCLYKMNVQRNENFINRAINSNMRFIASTRFEGHSHSEATKQKLRDFKIGWKHSAETKDHMKNLMKEQRNLPEWKAHMSTISSGPKSDIHKQKTKEALKAYWDNKQAEIVKCPHCDKEGIKHAMQRWHFTNCKAIKSL